MSVNFVQDMQQGATLTMPPASRVGGRQRVNLGNYLTLATLALNDVLVLARIPSDAIALEVSVGHGDLDSNGTPTLLIDVGLCDKDGNNLPGAADSRQCFVNAYSAIAAVVLTDRRFATAANVAQPAWQLAGMTADPAKPVYVCLRISTAAATWANGNIFWRIRFVDNS